ncbi:MAG: MarR family transcriptional regulator [Clostridiales bacterium]|nr:MarR family transcriptional regulator [Clostridiales bacterium]
MEEIGSGISILKMMKQIMDAMKQNIWHQFKVINLTGPQGMLILILAHYGKMKISDLSERLTLSNSTVSGIVDRLEKQGLVERIRSKDDRRVIYVNITSESRKKVEKHHKEIEKRFNSMIQNATPDEIDKIITGLITLKRVFDRQNSTKID